MLKRCHFIDKIKQERKKDYAIVIEIEFEKEKYFFKSVLVQISILEGRGTP